MIRAAGLTELMLAQRAWRIRHKAIRTGEVQGQGYVGQAPGVADVLAVAYFHATRYRADEPTWEGRDRFLLSIGHYAIALCAALLEAGFIPEQGLETYGADDSRLPMSGMAAYTPGMEITGGSLGHGLGIAVGMALRLRCKGTEVFVYNLLSDGELNEGATWEAAMSASHHQLDKLIVLVDVHDQQADGPSSHTLGYEPLADRWRAFGWYAQRVDGNDIDALAAAFDNARTYDKPQPRVILCDTLMGRGVKFLEERDKTHFIRVEPDEWRLALDALNQGPDAVTS